MVQNTVHEQFALDFHSSVVPPPPSCPLTRQYALIKHGQKNMFDATVCVGCIKILFVYCFSNRSGTEGIFLNWNSRGVEVDPRAEPKWRTQK